MGDTDDEAPLVKEEPDLVDSSAISPQQRHVWKKALCIPHGLPGSLPHDVKQQWGMAVKPKDRNIIVNTFLSTETAYKDELKWEEGTMQKFRTVYKEKLDVQRGIGKTYTELRSDLGRGNLSEGQKAIEEGLECGDIT